MANRRIPLSDIDQLLSEKRSERRRLNFAMQYVRSAIKQLQQQQKILQDKQARQAAAVRGAKRGPGRPRKNQLPDQAQPAKRGPGRPRKNPLPEQAQPVKRGPGRPRKHPLPVDAPPVKRGPGRPKKEPLVQQPQGKRGPGRPRTDGRPPRAVAKPKGRRAKS